MSSARLTMEISNSGEPNEASEFVLESYTLGTDPVLPDEVQDEKLGKKSFMIVMSAKLVEFHRLTSSSLLRTNFPKVWIRSYEVQEDDSFLKTAEYSFADALPISFKLLSGSHGLSGYVTFLYGRADAPRSF